MKFKFVANSQLRLDVAIIQICLNCCLRLISVFFNAPLQLGTCPGILNDSFLHHNLNVGISYKVLLWLPPSNPSTIVGEVQMKYKNIEIQNVRNLSQVV